MNPNIFKARFRMSSTSFDKIYNMMKDHNIFTNVSISAQYDLMLQFLVVFFEFEAYENDTFRANVAASFVISTDVLLKFTKCVMVALLSLEKNVVCWSNAAEEEAIKLSDFVWW